MDGCLGRGASFFAFAGVLAMFFPSQSPGAVFAADLHELEGPIAFPTYSSASESYDFDSDFASVSSVSVRLDVTLAAQTFDDCGTVSEPSAMRTHGPDRRATASCEASQHGQTHLR